MSGPILVLGDSTRKFLAIVRSLGRRGMEVHAVPLSADAPALASRYLARIHRLPDHRFAGAAWMAGLSDLIDRFGFRLIIPCGDSATVALHHHSEALGRERLALVNEEAYKVFTDKAATRALASSAGVPVAPGRKLGTDDTAEALAGEFGLPLVLKPRTSFLLGRPEGKRQALVLHDLDSLRRAVAAADEGWLVEGFFPGIGIGVSVLARHGDIRLAFQHRRRREASETGASTSRVSEPLSPFLLADVERLAMATGLDGVAMFEFRFDPARGRHILLEVNARFWGSLPLAVAAGADFPLLLVEQSAGRDPRPLSAYRSGVVKRDLTGEYERLAMDIEEAGGAYSKARAWAAMAAAAPGLAWARQFDSWAEDDPAPFHAERAELLRRIAGAAARRIRRRLLPGLGGPRLGKAAGGEG